MNHPLAYFIKIPINYSACNIEYNPKLSEATPTTRVAYVKFMAHTMRRESNTEQQEETADKSHPLKSILRTASKTSAVCNLIQLLCIVE